MEISTGDCGFTAKDFVAGHWESRVLKFADAIRAAYADREAMWAEREAAVRNIVALYETLMGHDHNEPHEWDCSTCEECDIEIRSAIARVRELFEVPNG